MKGKKYNKQKTIANCSSQKAQFGWTFSRNVRWVKIYYHCLRCIVRCNIDTDSVGNWKGEGENVRPSNCIIEKEIGKTKPKKGLAVGGSWFLLFSIQF